MSKGLRNHHHHATQIISGTPSVAQRKLLRDHLHTSVQVYASPTRAKNEVGFSDGTSYQGSVVRGTAGLAGDTDTAATFPGTANSYITIPNPGWPPLTSVSVATWAVIDSSGGYGTIVRRGAAAHDWFIRSHDAESSGGLTFRAYADDGIGGVNGATAEYMATDDEPHLIVGTYDQAAAEVRIYVEGTLGATAGLAGTGVHEYPPETYYEGDIGIGSHSAGTSQNFKGVIDDVAVFDFALTPIQIATLSGNHYAAAVLALEPEAYWRLSEPVGSALDASGHGRAMAFSGLPTRAVPGLTSGSDRAVRLNGSTQWLIDTSPATNLADSFTISGWVNPDALGGAMYAQNGGPSLVTGLNGEVLLLKEGDGGKYYYGPYGLLTPGTRNHITVTKSGSTVAAYVNGDKVPMLNVGGEITFAGGTASSYIGTLAEAVAFFDGVVDDVSLWTRPLTEDEAIGLYVADSTPLVDYREAILELGPIGYWRLGEPRPSERAMGRPHFHTTSQVI